MVSRSSIESSTQPLFIENHINKLRSYSSSLQLLLSHLDSRSDQLYLALNSTKYQLKSLNLEICRIEELTTDLKQKFTPDLCLELSKIKNPNTTLVNLAENFLLFLNHPDPSWKVFRELMKNFDSFKKGTQSIKSENLNSELINKSIHISKNLHSIFTKIKKYPKGVWILAELISVIVEAKLKRLSYDECFSEYLGYKKKVAALKEKMTEVNSQILGIEEKIQEFRGIGLSACEENETSDSSFYSPICTQKVRVSSNIFSKGTASGGILGGGEEGQCEDVEEYFSGKGKEVSFEVFYDNTEIGCCRSRFFCF